MGIQNDVSVIRNCRRSLLHLTMLTSLVAAAASQPASASSASSNPTSSDRILNLPTPQNHRPAIPFCNDGDDQTIGRRLLYVTTLDGRLSALDISKGGKLHWSVPTGPGALISSNIHRLELTNNGQFVRMIPSLNGGIYKFDGESIDPIPITTDNLLSSSAKFSDDLVISGGKETRTYGISARTGQMIYECSMSGCINATDIESNTTTSNILEEDDDNNEIPDSEYISAHNPLIDDVIVVKRQTQTVRAVETRTGIERWNFSVGQHELDLVRPAECHDRKFSELDMAILDLDIKVVVPEGIICAFSKSNPSEMLWKYKFDHPIVSAWKIDPTDSLESIDMFSSAQWLWNRDDNASDMPLLTINPSIYVGMYDKQLYIQESLGLRKEIIDQSHLYTHLTADSALPKIPWRPIAATSNSLVIFRNTNENQIMGDVISTDTKIEGNELVPYDDEHFALSAQSVLNASEYVNGNGFYLYTIEDIEKSESDAVCDKNNSDKLPALEDEKVDNVSLNNTLEDELGFSLDDIDAPVKVVILSLWFWWKEIVVIAFTSAVLLNLFIGQRTRAEREIVVIERHIAVPTAMEATESSTTALLGPVTNNTTTTNTNSKNTYKGHRSLSESTSNSGEYFSSRFQSDFDLQRCLGRGGFGVVFEAKNKLDDCSYAIKRIALPNREESRMRVMREVKTLANCEHQNIVRYFQSWVEKPPPGWQEEEDNKWLAHEMTTSIQIDTPTETHSTFPHMRNAKGISIDKNKQLQNWMESIASTACSSDHESNHLKHIDDDNDEDSCVIFRSESQSLALKDDGDDSYVVFRSESQSLALKDKESEDSGDNSTENYVSNIRGKRHSNEIAIDIQSHSELNRSRNNIDYSQLSDSFQIEFVRSVSGETEEGDMSCTHNTTNLKKCPLLNRKAHKRPQDLALEISSGENNNNNNNNNNKCRDLLPISVLEKPIQNKVYLYIQMQLCRKESLRDWLRENRKEDRLDYIASIFHQIVDAVDYVHYKGLIHRDLKPSNIFFSQDGQIKIGDFGLVTDMADIPNIVTKCGDKTGLPSCARHTQQVGTHLYMSPEQLRGLRYDFKVDIYSLGLIFFELLVYFGTEMERIMTLRSLRDGKFPHDFSDQHPKEYELLEKMLSSRPEERPTTSELKTKINEILKLPDLVGDSDAMAMVAAARRLSRSRTFSSCE